MLVKNDSSLFYFKLSFKVVIRTNFSAGEPGSFLNLKQITDNFPSIFNGVNCPIKFYVPNFLATFPSLHPSLFPFFILYWPFRPRAVTQLMYDWWLLYVELFSVENFLKVFRLREFSSLLSFLLFGLSVFFFFFFKKIRR